MFAPVFGESLSGPAGLWPNRVCDSPEACRVDCGSPPPTPLSGATGARGYVSCFSALTDSSGPATREYYFGPALLETAQPHQKEKKKKEEEKRFTVPVYTRDLGVKSQSKTNKSSSDHKEQL